MTYEPREALSEIAEMIEESWVEIASGQAELSHIRWLLAEMLHCAKAGLDELPDDSEDSLTVTILRCASPRP